MASILLRMIGATGRGLSQLFGPSAERLIPLGITYGDVIFAANVTGSDGSMRGALDTLGAVVEEAAASLDNVARVTAYVPHAADREPVYGPWDALFPDPNDRPAFKVLVAPLSEDVEVRLDMLALRGGRRRRIDIEGVSARDPTVSVGGWTLTSRVHGTDPATGNVATGGLDIEAQQAIANIQQLVRLSGGDRLELSQLVGFVRDAASCRVPAEGRRSRGSTHRVEQFRAAEHEPDAGGDLWQTARPGSVRFRQPGPQRRDYR